MALLFTNNARGALASGIDADDLLIVLEAGQGALFPVPSGGNTFRATLQDAAGNIEIVTCTARSADLLTITRAAEGTTARAFIAGTPIGIRLTAGSLDQYAIKANNLSDVANVATARTNLGLGTAAIEADTKYAFRANNLSDLASVSTARTNLGLVIGQHVQAHSAQLTSLAALARTLNAVIIGDGTNWQVMSGADLRTALGLKSMAQRKVTVSAAGPLGGDDEDIWFKTE